MEKDILKRKRIVVVANPAAQNGHGAVAASWLRGELEAEGRGNVRVVETSRSGEAKEIAAGADADVVIALGGDGVIHEVACGLAARPVEERAVLGVLPCGNGNDFARTLGMPVDDVRKAWYSLKGARIRSFDLGICNGVPFVQTLSFGLDAAIALGTEERRRRTGRSGTALFVEEGASQLLFHRDVHRARIVLDGLLDSEYPPSSFEEALPFRNEIEAALAMHLLAVQVGRTYGGGFDICPFAKPDDGAFDIVVAHAPLGLVRAASIFLKAKDGKHLRFPDDLTFWRARKVRISFEAPVPVQIDGERFDGLDFEVTSMPGALKVLTV